jgi:hypothetical protein
MSREPVFLPARFWPLCAGSNHAAQRLYVLINSTHAGLLDEAGAIERRDSALNGEKWS